MRHTRTCRRDRTNSKKNTKEVRGEEQGSLKDSGKFGTLRPLEDTGCLKEYTGGSGTDRYMQM
jgi:hypothetical protein